MADDTEDQVEAPAGVELQRPAPINHGRAMGFSQRGNSVPQGTDLGADESPAPDPQVATSESLPADSINPQSDVGRAPDDKQARYAAARAKVNEAAQKAYQDAYSRSQPVNPNGPIVQPLAYRQAEQQSDREYQQAQVEQRRQRMIQNQQVQAQAQATGQKMTRDAQGNLVPELEPRTNRPLYHATPWSVGKDPKTGEPALTMIDQYGQRQFKAPKVVSSPDLTDDQLYYQMPDGTQQPAGKIDELTKHPNFTIARQAMQAARSRRAAIWKEATAPLEDVDAQTSTAYDLAKQRNDDLQTQADQLQEKLGSYSDNQLNETQGGILGIGATPTANAQKAQTEKAAVESQLGQIQAEQAKLAEQLKPGGQLYRSRQQAKLDLAIFKAKAAHDNYADLADERRAILRSQGKSEAGDATLQSILQAQQTYGAAISRYGSAMQKTASLPSYAKPAASGAAPGTTPTPISQTSVTPPNSTGERLPLGAPVPGKPGVFESVHGEPHLNDPVAGEPAAPSKYTLASQPQAQAQPEATPSASQPTPTPAGQPQPAPTANAGSDVAPTQEQASEPFALAQKGKKSVGGVSVSELARRYGSGQGEVSPQSLVKLKQRSGEIADMLTNAGTQLDGKVMNSLNEEKDYLDSLYTQRFARLPVEAQNTLTRLQANQETSAVGAAGRAAGTGVGPAAAFAAGFAAGSRLLAPTAGSTRGIGPLVGGLAGGTLASILANKAQNAALKKIAPETHAELQDFQAKDAEQHPLAKTAGEAAANAAVFKVEPALAARGVAALYKIAKGEVATKAEQMAAKAFAVQSGLATTQSVVQPLVEGEKVTPGGVASSVAQMLLFGTPRGALGRLGEPPAKPAPKPAPPPFEPTGEGLPKTALESAKVLAPEKPTANAPVDVTIRQAEDAKRYAANQTKAPAKPEAPLKPAQESANVITATEALKHEAAAKEERAQKIVDDLQQTTGKSRGEILATREGKPIDDWIKELDKEAKYQKNPLVVDPERRANELREQIKQSDADWQKHLDKLAADAEAAAQGDQTKAAALERFNQLKSDALTRHEELRTRREAIENELTAAERLRQSPEGAAKLKEDLAAKAKGDAAPEAKEDPVADRKRYDEIQGELRRLTKEGKTFDDPEVAALFKENEALKNRNSSDPGMPPEPISEPKTQPKETTNAVQKPSAGEKTLRNQPKSSQGVRQENAVDQGAPAVRQPKERGEPAPRGEGKPVVRAEGNEARPAGVEGKQDAGQKGEAAVRAEVAETEGFKKLNPLAQKRFNAAYDAKNARLMGEYLDPQNPSFRAEFEQRTGVKLPKTIGGTEKAVADHFAGGEKAVSAGEQKATPQPSGKAATETAPPKEERQGSGEKKVEPVSKKGKRISVGQHPITGDDILNHIEQNGGVQTKSGASRPGGEHDDLGSSFSGVARLLLRKDGVEPDKMAQILHQDGLIPDGSVTTMNAAVEKAVRSRQMARRAVGAQEYGQKFEQAFLGNEPSKKWLKSDKPISVDDLVAGDKFEVNGEKFEVKSVDENGNVTIKDGITKEVPAGTPIYPDKGKIQKAKRSADFIPKEELFGAEETPFNLAGEKQAESKAKNEEPTASEAQSEMFKIEQIVQHKDPVKSADAAMELYGDPAKAAERLEKQLAIFDSDPANRKNFDKEQRGRLKEVVSLLRERAAEAKGPSTTDKIISALQNAKINKPGEGKVFSSDPLTFAYDAALDTAILGIKAGRSLAHMIQLALTRFRAAYPKATKADEARLEQAIREAHGSASEAKSESKPEAQAQKKAEEVLSSPKVEQTKTTLIDRWNRAAKTADLKQTLAYTRDVADNQAGNTAKETRETVANELARNVPKADSALAQEALSFHVEAGKEGRKALAEMKAKIEASTKADPKWKAKAIEAIDYADKHYDDLKSTADLYNQFTDQQVNQEQAAGMPTLKRDNYVMHAQDVDEGGWLDRGGGMSPTGASNRKNRVHDTFADSIAAGVDPKTLNAVDLLQTRVKNGQTGINLRQWQQSLHNYVDPTTKEPIAIPSPREERIDGTYYYQPPKGYKNEFLNGTPISVKEGYDGTIAALTDPSWWSKTKERRAVQKVNAAGKSSNLLFDTFHFGRLMMMMSRIKAASISDFRAPLPSYKKGLLILDHSPDEMVRMAKHGEIPPESLPSLLEKKKNLNLLIAAGFNSGHIADAMHQELVRKIPGIGNFNKFLFEDFQRGAMSEAALIEFGRQSKMYPELKPAEVARKVAKDINTRFGNLNRQGLFKSRTAQDLARLFWLAPQWNEGLIRSELGGVGQIATSIKDAATGKRLAMGALGRDMIGSTLGIFAANQLINQMTRGKYTWENPEEGWGSKVSAWIPDIVGGKGSGFFLNPLGVTAEISHLLLNNYERTESGWRTALNFFRSRASAISRPAWTAATEETALGAKIKPKDMTKEIAKSSVPLPIGAEALTSAVRGTFNHGNTETYPGQFQKQAMSSMGLKTDSAPSPEQRMGKLAKDFNKTKKIEPSAEFYAGDYTDMDNALRRDNADDIKDELEKLTKKFMVEKIAQRYRSWSKHPFTGKRDREAEFIRTLNPEQKRTYLQAKKNRLELGGRALKAINRLPPSVRHQSVNN